MKVFLNCPTHEVKEYCLIEYGEAVKALTYPHLQILLGDNSPTDDYSKQIQQFALPVIRTLSAETARERIITARNILREAFQKSDCEYFFSLEQDVLPPPDTIQRLLSHKKKIISGIYLNPYETEEGLKAQPVLWKDAGQGKMQKFTKEELRQPQLIEVKAAGLGCILIHREVLEKLQFRYDREVEAFDDVFFCKDARTAGYQLYADTSVKCKHAIKGGQWNDIKK
jgi:GT2 family glycosyltransferase